MAAEAASAATDALGHPHFLANSDKRSTGNPPFFNGDYL
jgi:hypothetical protein